MTSAAERIAPVSAHAQPHLIGYACAEFRDTYDAVLDELVFDVTERALAQCRILKPEIGLSVTASMDVYDGRSISSGLTNSASGGYLADSYRIEGDGGLATHAAAQALASGDADVALAVAVFNPETTTTSGSAGRAMLDQLSNLAFDPFFHRPVGLTGNAALALQMCAAIESGAITLEALADIAAAQISRGAGRARAYRRNPVTATDVLDSAPVATPLTELMLPAVCAGAAAVVLASPARAARTPTGGIRLSGFGHGANADGANRAWLDDPAAGARNAAAAALRQSGMVDREATDFAAAEFTAATPALVAPLLEALGVSGQSANSGGVASSYPGVVNGLLRLIELADALGDKPKGAVGLSHSADLITGSAMQSHTVVIAEVL